MRGEQFAVALALINENGIATIGLLGCPKLPNFNGSKIGCLFEATYQSGARERDLDSGDAVLTLGASPKPNLPITMLESYEVSHTVPKAHEGVFKACHGAQIHRMDSQVKYGVLARSKAHIMPRVTCHDNCIWDIAPGSVILSEAGGLVTDAAGQPLKFNLGRSIHSNVVLCSSPGSAALHQCMVETLKILS